MREEEEEGEHTPPHTVQGGGEVLPAERVLLPQQHALLQRHGHRRAVLCALTAGQTNSVHLTTHLNKQRTHTHTKLYGESQVSFFHFQDVSFLP